MSAVALLGGVLFAAAPRASAAQIPLTVRINHILQVENPDGGVQGDGDYFVRVKIGSNGYESASLPDGRTDERPNFKFTKNIDDTATTIVNIELRDEDGGFGGGDDVMDINPTDQAVTLTFVVDPVARTWTSPDLPANASVARGDGDHDFPDTHDGLISEIGFDFLLVGSNPDIDGDGIPDAIERFGVRNPDGSFVAGGDFASLGADPCRKSIAVQIDYMNGAADGHSHQPKPAAIAETIAAFNAAPVPAVTPCPYPGTHAATGMDFVAIPGKAIGEQTVMGFDSGYHNARNANFPARLGPYAQYAIFVHDQAAGSSSSGLCCDDDRDNKDFLVSLGSWRIGCVSPGADGVLNTAVAGDDQVSGTSIVMGPNRTCDTTANASSDDGQTVAVGTGAADAEVGTVRDQSGSIMHELGHSISLGHGGGNATNYKPNYLSVMNYQFDPGGIPTGAGTSRLDYSRSKLADLDKTTLSESAGIGDGTDFTAWLDSAGKQQVGRGNAALDWNGNGSIDGGTVNVDLNSNDDDAAKLNPLTGYDDWANLNFRAVDVGSGKSASEHGPDIGFAEVLQHESTLRAYFDPDLKAQKSVDKADAEPGDTLTYTISVTNIGTGPATAVTAVDTLPDGTTVNRSLSDAPVGAAAQTFTVTYVLPCATPNLTVVTNTVKVSGKDAAGGPETKTANNTASASTTAHAPVLAITKTASTPARPGEAITYTITVTNTGSAAAQQVALSDRLAAELYYSAALDAGAGPKPTTVTANGDGSTGLGWPLGSVAAGATRTIVYTARPSLLLRSGDVKTNSATVSATNGNGCVVAPVSAGTSSTIAEAPIVGKPFSHGFWKAHEEVRPDEIRARVQATDQRWDTGPTIGELSNPETTTGLKGDNGLASELKSRTLAALLNLATHSTSSSTPVDSVTARRLGITDVAGAVRYALATLALDPAAAKARYQDAKQLLDAINGPG